MCTPAPHATPTHPIVEEFSHGLAIKDQVPAVVQVHSLAPERLHDQGADGKKKKKKKNHRKRTCLSGHCSWQTDIHTRHISYLIYF